MKTRPDPLVVCVYVPLWLWEGGQGMVRLNRHLGNAMPGGITLVSMHAIGCLVRFRLLGHKSSVISTACKATVIVYWFDPDRGINYSIRLSFEFSVFIPLVDCFVHTRECSFLVGNNRGRTKMVHTRASAGGP